MKQQVTLRLPTVQMTWLQDMASKYELSDAGKAMRCCINFAAQESIVLPHAEECAQAEGDFDCELAPSQFEWLEGQVALTSKSPSACAMQLISICQEANASSVFEVVRCKTKTTLCEGAQEAIAKQELKKEADRMRSES